MVEQSGIAPIQRLERARGIAHLLHQVFINLNWRRGAFLHQANYIPAQFDKPRAQRLLIRNAVLKILQRVPHNGLHGSLQFLGERSQQLKVFLQLAIPFLSARRYHSVSFPGICSAVGQWISFLA
jgi:hypothetical protein